MGELTTGFYWVRVHIMGWPNKPTIGSFDATDQYKPWTVIDGVTALSMDEVEPLCRIPDYVATLVIPT